MDFQRGLPQTPGEPKIGFFAQPFKEFEEPTCFGGREVHRGDRPRGFIRGL